MSLFPPKPTTLAHDLLRGVLRDGDVAIDATAGNGHDTLFLAQCVGANGKVIAFDVQAEALVSTRERLAQAELLGRVSLVLGSHAALMAHAAPQSVAAVMFNLGYLPGADHAVITSTDDTLCALDAAVELLKPGGCLSIVCYPGHAGGDAEAERVTAWTESLTAGGWQIARYGRIATLRPAPFLLIGAKPRSTNRKMSEG